MLAIQVSGNGSLDQDGRQTRLEAGDFSFVDTTRPYKLYFEGPFEQQAFCISRKLLERQVPCLSRYTARRYEGRRGAAAVAAGFILNLASNAHLLGQEGLESYQITAAELISAAVDAERELIDAKDLVRFERVRSRLAKMARDPDVAFDRVATVERVSLRTLQRLFHLNGTTPTKWLLEYRLGRSP
jgi:AraC-like DNA-binding protein